MPRPGWQDRVDRAQAREEKERDRQARKLARERGGTMNSTSFRDVPQREDPSIINTFSMQDLMTAKTTGT